MSMLPPNTTAQAMNAPPTTSGQFNTAVQQQSARAGTYEQIASNQSVAAANNLGIEAATGSNTAENLAVQTLANHVHDMKTKAGLTDGAQNMALLAKTYAPEGGDIATITNAIHKGLRL